MLTEKIFVLLLLVISGLMWILYKAARDAPNLRPASLFHDLQSSGNESVIVYVLDSGVRSTHDRLRGKVLPGARFYFSEKSNSESEFPNSIDGLQDVIPGDGHGTFVASIATRYLDSARVKIVPLVVVDSSGQGDSAALLDATEFAISHHRRRHPQAQGVLLLSLAERQPDAGWLATYVLQSLVFSHEPLDEALVLADKHGFVTVMAAGNFNTNTCLMRKRALPPSAIIVGAMTANCERAHYSSYGSCVTLFARGISTAAASARSDESIRGFIGTSVSAPVVVNRLVRFISSKKAGVMPSNHDLMESFLKSSTASNVVKNMGCRTIDMIVDRTYEACSATPTTGLVDQPLLDNNADGH